MNSCSIETVTTEIRNQPEDAMTPVLPHSKTEVV